MGDSKRTFSDEYYSYFNADQIRRNDNCIRALSDQSAVAFYSNEIDDTTVSLTIVTYDRPGIFSIICGLIGLTGLNITNSAIFSSIEKHPDKIAVDNFEGQLDENQSVSFWLESMQILFRSFFSPPLYSTNLDGLRNHLSLEIAQQLKSMRSVDTEQRMYPITIYIEQSEDQFTKIAISSVDTPFFLYAIATALHLNKVSIERIEISTEKDSVHDVFYVHDTKGSPVTDTKLLNQLRLSIMFTKHFTYFIETAPNPEDALNRFESLLLDLLEKSNSKRFLDAMANPDTLRELATLLGMSDYIWEDFVRTHYENLFLLLDPLHEGIEVSAGAGELSEKINTSVDAAETIEEKKLVLNCFKNEELFKIDLDHILNQQSNFFFLSERLTRLAEAILSKALEISFNYYTALHGKPLSIGGLEAEYCLAGLGKLGGKALGYASDIEILFIYSDSGKTSGIQNRQSILSNGEFFEQVMKLAVSMIDAKKEGIFDIDLRLRPYGSHGPLACSMENFVRYYSKGGEAHSFERLALLRLRPIGGSKTFGAKLSAVRDEIIYNSDSINPAELFVLRKKQLRHKTQSGKLNAKFSPGGLVDIEYAVQILQIRFGRENTELRSPSIHKALEALTEQGVLNTTELENITGAYRFLRTLINGLRILRGNAKDLDLPDTDSLEFTHLARRIGYTGESGYHPAEELLFEFQTRTAHIRLFVEKHLGDDSLSNRRISNIADFVLDENLTEEQIKFIFGKVSFENIPRAQDNLRSLAKGCESVFSFIITIAWNILKNLPDPEMALNNWERFATELEFKNRHFKLLLKQPKRIEVLLKIFSNSQYLSNILIQHKEYFSWITAPETINKKRTALHYFENLEILLQSSTTELEWKKNIRTFKTKEMFRIAVRDICYKLPLEIIVRELSDLADAVIHTSLRFAIDFHLKGNEAVGDNIAVIAFGKLGGRELNYSSDIDLLCVHEIENADTIAVNSVIKAMRSYIEENTEDGFCYRVDFRLRPFGSQGTLVFSSKSAIDYYRLNASLWEFQAFLKARASAGNKKIGKKLIEEIIANFPRQIEKQDIIQSIEHMRDIAVKTKRSILHKGIDIKNDRGGIREIEFYLQSRQLHNHAKNPSLLTPTTLPGLQALKDTGMLNEEDYERLTKTYRKFRRIEHALQIFDDRQTHILPDDLDGLRDLAKRIDTPSTQAEEFLKDLKADMQIIRLFYDASTADWIS